MPWSATLGVGVSYMNGQGSLILTGTDGTTTLGLGVLPIAGPSTYVIAQGGGTTGSLQTPVGSTPAIWKANGLGAGTGSGSVTLTSLSSTGAAGTFFFMLVAQPFTAATGTRSITQGMFNVKF